MALSTQETRDLYRRRAARYDLAVWIYRLFGFRIDWYRQLTIEALNLSRGDAVVDLGCGTGLNFPFLQQALGSTGHIIGVDLTDAMLEVARARVRRAGWDNVDLLRMDMTTYEFGAEVAGVLSTLALTLVAEYDDVIRRATRSLQPGGRLAVFDLKRPANWPHWLVRLAAWMNRPFGVSLELAQRHPWESIRRYLREVHYQEYYFGALYLSVGEKPLST